MNDVRSASSEGWEGFLGAVFDLDGTLLDTIADIGNAANAVLRRHSFPTHPLSEYRQFVGEGVRVLLLRALPPQHRDDGTLNACMETMQSEYLRHLNQTAKPYPGVLELLTSLKERRFKLAVLSNKPDQFTTQCVTDFFGEGLFNPILGLREDRPRKPDPAGALEIAFQWGIPPSQILYFGDSGTDMQTATAAGMYPIGVLWGYRDGSELLATGARRVLKEPAALFNHQA